MSIVKAEDGKKWINSFLAITSIFAGYITIKFAGQIGEWFDLEAKVSNFPLVAQAAGIVIGLVTFVFIMKNKNAMGHLTEVYDELVKVIWPDKDSVLKVTVGIVIAVGIVSALFMGVDFVFSKILDLIY
jgi:preprotein translocase subunit SecE